MTDPNPWAPDREAAKARARHAAAYARQQSKYRPDPSPARLAEPPTCTVCGGTLASSYTEPTHPGCTETQETRA